MNSDVSRYNHITIREHLHVEHWPIKDILAGYIERDSKRYSRCQDIVQTRCPFASIVDGIQEGSVDALECKEDEHGYEQ